ncbi:MAG: hypothetical protein J0H62_08430 [Rhizobiales bacterium]|nr:hypothetical protein [Hyphomicrobiales bacterium]
MLTGFSTLRFGIATALCGLVVSTLPAAAQDDDASFETKIFRSLFGGSSSNGIDYRERSPLVIPPSTELPKPDSASAVTATPDWPNDPDAARGRTARTEKNLGGDPFEVQARPLSPAELRRGTAKQARSNEPARTLSEAEMGRTLTPAELGETRSVFTIMGLGSSVGKPDKFDGEPTRSRLVDPPTGYRTPTATQPYAPPKGEAAWYKPSTWFDRGVSSDR